MQLEKNKPNKVVQEISKYFGFAQMPSLNRQAYFPINFMWSCTGDPKDKDSALYLSPRPGTTSTTTDSNYTSIAKIYNWSNYNSNFNNALVYYGTSSGNKARITISDDGYSFDHADSNEINWLSEAVTAGGTPILTWARPALNEVWYYPKAGAVTSITVPSGATGKLEYMNGWFFIAANQSSGIRIYNCSTLNDPTSAYNDYIPCNIHTDSLVTLWRYKQYLVAFGYDSIEWFTIADNTQGSPLRSVPELCSRIGLVAPPGATGVPTIVNLNDTVYFIGRESNTNSIFLYKLDGTTPKKVSPPDMGQTFSITNAGIAGFTFRGTSIISISIGSGNYLIYFPDFDTWAFWTEGANFVSAAGPITVNNHTVVSSGNSYARLSISGSFTDFDIAWSQSIKTKPFFFGTIRDKIENSFSVVGTGTDAGVGTYLPFSVTVGDNHTASIEGGISAVTGGTPVGSTGCYQPNKPVTNLGHFNWRQYYLYRAAAGPDAIYGLEHNISGTI